MTDFRIVQAEEPTQPMRPVQEINLGQVELGKEALL